MESEKTHLTKTKALVEQHIHGGFGVDFANADVDGFLFFASEIKKFGVCAFYPTLATDSVKNLKRQIERIKEAQKIIPEGSAKISGIHLEACFLNPLKKGIHNEGQLLKPSIENYKLIEDEITKIVTLAPELDEGYELCTYLKDKGVTVSAGHCTAADLSMVSQITHMYNAMGEFSHKKPSTVVSALSKSDLMIELIADMKHVQKEVIEMTLKLKPHNKIRLISDALPIAHSNLKEMEFCGKKVYLKNGMAADINGTLAGSVMFVSDIIRKLVKDGILNLETAVSMASTQTDEYIYWDEDFRVVNA